MVKRMKTNGKIVVAVISICLVIIVAGLLIYDSFGITVEGEGAAVKVPNSFGFDEEGFLTNDEYTVFLCPVIDAAPKDEAKFFKVIKSNGKSSGYENVTSKTINGYKVYDYAASPHKLKNVTSGGVTYEPYLPFGIDDCDHFRIVTYVKGETVNYLIIFTDYPDVDLYTPEVEKIIDSVREPKGII